MFRTTILSLVAVLAGSAVAGPISIDPVNGVFVSAENVAGYLGDHTVNGSGLTGDQHGITSKNYMWASGSPITVSNAWIVFDLGAVYTVNSIRIWNYNSALTGETNYGVKDFSVKYGTTLFGTPDIFTNTLAGVTNLNVATGLATYTGEVFNAYTPFNAQYIAFDIDSNYGAAGVVGLAEVQFEGEFVSDSIATMPITGVVVHAVSSFEKAARSGDRTLSTPATVGSAFGLNIFGHHSGSPDNTMWLTAGGDSQPEITYDLGAKYDLERLQVWNYNEYYVDNPTDFTLRGINSVDILGSDDGVSFSPILSTNFLKAPGIATTNFAEMIDITAAARYIKLDVNSNHGGGGYYGLSEIKFFGDLWETPPAGTVIIVR